MGTHGLGKRLFAYLAICLLLVLGLPDPAEAAPRAEKVKSSPPEQFASILAETLSAGTYNTCGVKSDGTVVCWGDNYSGQTTPPAGIFTQVSAGYLHTCGVKSDGTIACWGLNNHGQTTPPAGTFTQVSAEYLHTCGVKSDGAVVCWGDNSFGQSTPPVGTFIQVSAGERHTCGVKSDGTLACWGENTLGQSTPPAGTFTRISAGGYHTCGVKSDGTLACWGINTSGQSTPPAGAFTQVSAGGYHTCGVKSDGTLACWGYNNYDQSIPPAGIFIQVSAGWYHTCGLKSDGTLTCWGDNSYGQSTPALGMYGQKQIDAGDYHTCEVKIDGTPACWGRNDSGQSTSPVDMLTQVSAGGDHTCGRRSDGTLICWGDNTYGQSTPPAGTFTQVSAGGQHTCGVKSDGTIACWGNNSQGQSAPPSGTYMQISAGSLHTCGVKSDGTVICWGYNYFGQSIPPAGTFTQVSAGGHHTCGVKSVGTIVCWGRNLYGQSTPPAGTFNEVNAGYAHTCGVKSNGALACWGDNIYSKSTPPAGTFTEVSAGYGHTCGVRSGGTIACWGDNAYAQRNPPLDIYGNVGAAGATLTYDDGGLRTATSNNNGDYLLTIPYNWSGAVTPDRAGYAFTPHSYIYSNVLADQTNQNYWVFEWPSWYGGAVIMSDRNVVAVGRPHVGSEVASYSGFAIGSTTQYVPMLFKQMWGSYDSALYIQNTDAANAANITIDFYDPDGNQSCEKTDSIQPMSSHGYWLPYESCLPANWYGGVVVTSDRNIVAVGRPHIGDQVATYDGFAGGSTSMYVPMLFKQIWGYDSALYIQNTDPMNTATVTIKFYDPNGVLNCEKTDWIPRLSSHGYWLPSESCLPDSWYGGVVVTADRNIVAVGRPHLGSEVTTYNGFASGSLTMYAPMLFKGGYGSYDSALYVQNVNRTDTANINIKFYSASGNLSCTHSDTVPPGSSKGYWLPEESCLPDGWIGSAKVESNRNVVVIGRPHLGSSITAYDGIGSGGAVVSVPMLFKQMWGSYDSALYIENTDPSNTANVTTAFYDVDGNLSCVKVDTIGPLATLSYWLPSLACSP